MSDLARPADDLLAGRLRRLAGRGQRARPDRVRRAPRRPLGRGASRKRDADAATFLGRFDALGDDGLDRRRGASTATSRRDAARPDDPGRLAGLAARPARPTPGPITAGIFTLFLHRLRPERELVDASIARLGQVGAAVDAGSANLDPALAHPLIVERGLGSAQGRRRATCASSSALEVEDARRRERLRAAGDGAAGEHSSAGSRTSRASRAGARHLAARRGALQPDPPGARGARRRRPVAARPRARPSSTGSTRRCARWPADATGNRRLGRGPRAGRRGPPADRGGDAPGLRGLDGAARGSSCATRAWSTLPEGEVCVVEPSPVFQRPVLGVASYMAPPAFSDRWTGHFFVPVRARRHAGGGDPEAARRATATARIPTTAGPRGLPGPPLAPRHAQGATRRSCGGSTRRPTSPRAGRCTPSA